MVRESLLKIENGLKEIKICGSQNPGFGNYLGVVSDENLNKIYNESKYLLYFWLEIGTNDMIA